ncbi:hypothetical protein [uncultured Nocardioides sp.]|uniref:hypothetical protein n=1 Tax=uncultured Nocardioides sp. TaxID=198441 RepID=UPI002634EAD3|nr:hypothetical protein [uncultured Nocardioides sp.]
MTLATTPPLALLDDSFPLPLDRPFSVTEAAAEGVTANMLTRLVRQSLLRRPVQGAYVAVQAGDSLRIRAQALGLVVPEDAIVCDRHAAWLRGAEMALAPGEHLALRPISLFRPSGHGRIRRALADSGERNLLDRDTSEVHGLRVTTPLRTALDLGRVRSTDMAISAMDATARLGHFGLDELLAEVPRFAGMRWVTTLRAIAPLVDPRSESPGESVLRLRWLETGLGRPVPQVEVRELGRLLARLDLGHEEIRFAAEYDGEEWHSSPEQLEHDRDRRSYLCRERDWTIVAARKENVFGHHQDVDALLRGGHAEALGRLGTRLRW